MDGSGAVSGRASWISGPMGARAIFPSRISGLGPGPKAYRVQFWALVCTHGGPK